MLYLFTFIVGLVAVFAYNYLFTDNVLENYVEKLISNATFKDASELINGNTGYANNIGVNIFYEDLCSCEKPIATVLLINGSSESLLQWPEMMVSTILKNNFSSQSKLITCFRFNKITAEFTFGGGINKWLDTSNKSSTSKKAWVKTERIPYFLVPSDSQILSATSYWNMPHISETIVLYSKILKTIWDEMLYGKFPIIEKLFPPKTFCKSSFRKSFSIIIFSSIPSWLIKNKTDSLSISTSFKLYFFLIKNLVRIPVPGPISKTFLEFWSKDSTILFATL